MLLAEQAAVPPPDARPRRVTLLRSLGLSHLRPPPPPPQEAPSRLRRTFEGLRHSLGRDAEAIHHHYDVSNPFYELRPRPVDDLHLRGLPAPRTPRWRRRRPRSTTWSPASSTSSPASGCSTSAAAGAAWSATPPASTACTRSASPCPASRPTWAQEEIKEEGLDHLAEVRHLDYRHVEERDSTRSRSIGLTEHIGVKQLPGVLRLHPRPAAPAGPAAQPLHHPPRQPPAARPARSSTATSSPTAS